MELHRILRPRADTAAPGPYHTGTDMTDPDEPSPFSGVALAAPATLPPVALVAPTGFAEYVESEMFGVTSCGTNGTPYVT